ncbi:hypothetical protein ACTA71_006595 [Dictyostelium dimigraforme]
MSTTVNNDTASGNSSSSNNANSFDHRIKSIEEQINNLSLAFTRLMEESSKSNSDDSAIHNQDDSDSTEKIKNWTEQCRSRFWNRKDVPPPSMLKKGYYMVKLDIKKAFLHVSIALKDVVIPFGLYTRQTNNFHTQCLTLADGD